MHDPLGPNGYEHPLGQSSRVARSLTSLFAHKCYGRRFLLGEILKRNDKVLYLKTGKAYNEGIRMEAEVVSSDLKAPRRRYVTTITVVAPFTDEQMHAARIKITAQPCWKALIRYPPSVVGTPLLERLKFAGVPYQLMEVLDYHWGSVNESEVIKASCTCNDKYTKGCWCKHVAALSFELVELCETHPESLGGRRSGAANISELDIRFRSLDTEPLPLARCHESSKQLQLRVVSLHGPDASRTCPMWQLLQRCLRRGQTWCCAAGSGGVEAYEQGWPQLRGRGVPRLPPEKGAWAAGQRNWS